MLKWTLMMISPMGPSLYSQDFSIFLMGLSSKSAASLHMFLEICCMFHMFHATGIRTALAAKAIPHFSKRKARIGFHPSRYGRPRPLEWVPHCRGLPTSKDTREVEGESLKLRVPYSWWLNGWMVGNWNASTNFLNRIYTGTYWNGNHIQ